MATSVCSASRALGAALAITALLGACSISPVGSEQPSYPLGPCTSTSQANCVAPLFARPEAIAIREPGSFPLRYLELYDEKVRDEDCASATRSEGEKQSCVQRLTQVAAHFNPPQLGKPGPGEIGVALEGGGSKAAPFALGTLAGLHQMGLLDRQVRAISSVSGGSYAASYYYNRLYDRAAGGKDAGTPDDWFRPCIPEAVLRRAAFASIAPLATGVNCRELDPGSLERRHNEFSRPFEFVGHVWRNPDLLRGDSPGSMTAEDGFRSAEYGNLLWLGAQTLVTVPFQLVSRTLFRWPLNSSPSKLAYKLGIERQYGYSPHDWRAAGSTDLEHMNETLFERRKTRTLRRFGQALAESKPPLWVIAATAPGDISAGQWIVARARDPLRQQFELTFDGYGSGTYGYAREAPQAQFDLLGRNPDSMPVLDAVVASAAFLDDDQTQISRQPFRFFAGAGQHFLNLTWFSELRNYNVGDGPRFLAKVLPWPLYLLTLSKESRTPYIHLQDGGNSENTGILPLLRRGYRTIVYAHGTQDVKAQWDAICHLKNQLELDDAYFVRSADLDRFVADRPLRRFGPQGSRYYTYLDEVCSDELDASDLAAFDRNAAAAGSPRRPVARLYCARLGKEDASCPEFTDKFEGSGKGQSSGPGVDPRDLLFRWPSNRTLTFKVYRGSAVEWMGREPGDSRLLSTIVAIVPGASAAEAAALLRKADGAPVPSNWPDWCAAGVDARRRWKVQACLDPQQNMLGQAGGAHGLPCTVLAHLLEDSCRRPASEQHPDFPQDNFVLQTIHSSYLTYAAYFELARHEVRESLCALWATLWPDGRPALPPACRKP